MQKVGDILKAAREKKGLSLHEIGMTLKINPKILKAIEDNDSTQLPAKTFLRGFVRSYAQYLRLDASAILNLLQGEIGPARAEPTVQTATPEGSILESSAQVSAEKESAPKTEKTHKIEHDSGMTGKKILKFAGTSILIVLIIFVAKMIDKYQKESRLPKIEIEETQKVVAKDPVPANPILPTTVPAESIQEVAAPPMSAMSAMSSTPTPPPLPTVAPTPTATPIPSVTPVVTPKMTPVAAIIAKPTAAPTMASPSPSPSPASATASPTPAPSVAPVNTKPVEVIVEALNKVEVRYSFDDQKYETLSLMADELHTFKSKTGIKLEFSDGGAISLIVNGRDRGVPGSIGKPLKLSYPK